MPATEEAAAELFDDIDVVYFLEREFDPINYELQVVYAQLYPSYHILENDWYGA